MNNHVTITGGVRSVLTGGDYSVLTGGEGSQLTGGCRSQLTGGEGSQLTGGRDSILTWDWWDYGVGRVRRMVAYVGEDGIEPNVAYKCVMGKVMRAKEADE